MIAIIADNDWVYLDHVDSYVESILVDHFSARHPRHRFIDVDDQSWDGYYRKYNTAQQRIARPFLAELQELCKKKNIPLDVVDNRPPPKCIFNQELLRDDILAGITLEPHQMKALEAARSNEVGIFAHNTGAGKCTKKKKKILVNGEQMQIGHLFHDIEDEEVKDVSNFGLWVFGPTGYSQIHSLYKTAPRSIIRIDLEDGHTIRGDHGHKIFTRHGFKSLKEIEIGDEVQVYPKKSIINGTKWGNSAKAGKALWKSERPDNTKTIYKISMCVVRQPYSKKHKESHNINREAQRTTLCSLYQIIGFESADGKSPEEKRKYHSVQVIPENQQSDERSKCSKKSTKDMPREIWSCSACGSRQSRQEKGGTKRVGNQKSKRNITICSTCDRQIQRNHGKEDGKRDRRYQKKEIGNLEEEPQHKRIYKRVIFESSQDTRKINNYTIWENNLPKQTRTSIYQVVREIEEYIESDQRTDNKTRKFMVLIRFLSEDNQTDMDNRNKVEVLIRDEEGRDIGEEKHGNQICENEINDILINSLRKTQEFGFNFDGKWSPVTFKADDGVENCYDLQVIEDSHTYWINDVLSHNTEVMAAIAKILGCPTVIIAEKRVIIEQIRERLELRDVVPEVGMFYCGATPDGQLIVVGSIQSLSSPPISMKRKRGGRAMYNKRLKRAQQFQAIVKKADLLMVDEADLATSKGYKNLFRYHFNGRRKYGFSATPFEKSKPVDNLVLREHLGSVISKSDRRALEGIGRIIPVVFTMFAFGEDGDRQDKTAFDIAEREIMIDNKKFHQMLLRIVGKFPSERNLILLDTSAIEDFGKHLEDLISDSKFIYGKTSKQQRNEYIKRFEDGKLSCLIGSKIIKRGLDLKGGVDNLIICGGGKQHREQLQKIGRAVRNNERGFARVFSFFFLNNYYLYRHSREQLKAVVGAGYKTNVVFKGKVVDGAELIKSRFRLIPKQQKKNLLRKPRKP